MQNPKSQIPNPKLFRRGFTLMELLIVMLIITVLAALSLAALQGVTEEARADRTRAIIAKLDQLIMDRYEGYRTRTLPIRLSPGLPPKSEPFTDANSNGFWNAGEAYTDTNLSTNYNRGAAWFRLMALRELMRMELPDRRSDVIDFSSPPNYPLEGTATGMTISALQRSYYRKALQATGGTQLNTAPLANWTDQHQGSECLYLIVSAMQDGDKNALDFFMPSEIGDTDQDGMQEILDAWGTPIEFLRWAPGYRTLPGPDGAWGDSGTDDDGNGTTDDYSEAGQADDVVPQTMQTLVVRDPFDPVREDARADFALSFALRPLIFSAGRDKNYDVVADLIINGGALRYAFPASPPFPTGTGPSPNDPYISSSGAQLGMVGDIDGDGEEWQDNITNHYQETNAQ